ncbi:ubiquitin carboxyl-terminal hydrolase [Pseudoscourfieldia marina]
MAAAAVRGAVLARPPPVTGCEGLSGDSKTIVQEPRNNIEDYLEVAARIMAHSATQQNNTASAPAANGSGQDSDALPSQTNTPQKSANVTPSSTPTRRSSFSELFRRAWSGLRGLPTATRAATKQEDASIVRLPDVGSPRAPSAPTTTSSPRWNTGRFTPNIGASPRIARGGSLQPHQQQFVSSLVAPPRPNAPSPPPLLSAGSDSNDRTALPQLEYQQPATRANSGMSNLGNTCYLNATMQVLASVPALGVWAHARKKLTSSNVLDNASQSSAMTSFNGGARRALWPNNANGGSRVTKNKYKCFTDAFANIVSRLATGNPVGSRIVLEPCMYRNATNERLPLFAGADQHDMHEYMSAVLHALDEDETKERTASSSSSSEMKGMSGGSPRPNQSFGKENHNPDVLDVTSSPLKMRSPSDTFVRRTFCGGFCTSSTCLACGHTAEHREPFLDLSVPITRPSVETVHLPAPPMTPTPPPRPAPPSGGRFTGSTGRRRTTQRRAPTPGRKHVVLEESSSPVTIPTSTINAPAVTSPEAKQDGAIQLEECLSALLQPETMTGSDAPRCDVCSSRVGRQRTIRVESHPRVLILHLKRFVYELGDNPMDGYTPKRVDDELVIPRSLHVPGMAAKPKQSQQSHPPQPASPSRLIFGLLGANRNTPSTPSTPKTPQIGATYELHAVAHHEGCLQLGHYYADCLDFADGQWYRKDDDNVMRLAYPPYHDGNLEDDMRTGSSTAYMLVYVRKQDA